MSLILGIDPGKSGALCLYDPGNGELAVYDVPTFELSKAGRKHKQLDLIGLAGLVDNAVKGRSVAVWIEQVGSRPGEAVSSAFDFGTTYGVLLGVCAAHFLRIERVAPVRWKRALNVPADKDGARAAASRLFPRHAHHWTRVKDDGRAEAALIALYGAQNDHFANQEQHELV